MLEKYIEIIKPYIIDLFKDDSSGHDMKMFVNEFLDEWHGIK